MRLHRACPENAEPTKDGRVSIFFINELSGDWVLEPDKLLLSSKFLTKTSKR